MKLWFKHYHYDVFQPFEVYDFGIDHSEENLPQILFNFHTNSTGDINEIEVKLEPTIDALTFKREIEEIEVNKNELEKFVGEYELAGAELKVYIKKEALYFFVSGQPEYEQVPTGKNKFSFKSVDGFGLEFIEDENGNITAVMIIQSQGNFTASKK